MKRILTGAALDSHLVRVWNFIQQAYRSNGARINYYTHALLLAVAWNTDTNKWQQIELASQLVGVLCGLLPADEDLPVVARYLAERGWEKPGEGLIYDEDTGSELIYASTITELFAVYKLMPLRWGPAKRAGESTQLDKRERFRVLASRWKEESGPMSNSDDMVRLSSYQEIISLGAEAIPWILAELATAPDFWFHALRQLTGQNPVPRAHAGKVTLMAQDWLEWGAANGYPYQADVPEWQKRGFFDRNDGWG